MEYLEENVFGSSIQLPEYSFEKYLNNRKIAQDKHMVNGVPDYSFALDRELRKNLDKIPGLYKAAKLMMETYVSRRIQELNMDSLAVGPNQFKDVYEIGCECAERLGIGVPNIFIENTEEYNAYTYAFDDMMPVIVICNRLYEAMTPGELKSIIGHECGHIHNNHGVYNTVAAVIASVGTQGVAAISLPLAKVISMGAGVALNAWSRAAEVTCDRAGMICADRPEDFYNAMAKIMFGGRRNEKVEIDFDAIKEQLQQTTGSAVKYKELIYSHPITAKRIAAGKEFEICETYYSWRPDMKNAGVMVKNLRTTEEECRAIIDVANKGRGMK